MGEAVPAESSGAGLAALYGDRFFDELEDEVASSAAVVVPTVCSLVTPRSVLDIGCGRGTWLREFAAAGVTDIVGVDGPHISVETLEIPADSFVAADLTEPLALGRSFDLVVSLEVGEHLPRAVAPTFVASLVRHAPAVLFSAAIPHQGGPGHVNEAWQSEWAARFAEHGYEPLDVVRPIVWSDERVAYWYAQNMLLYVDASTRAKLGDRVPPAATLDVVHPRLLLADRNVAAPKPLSLSRLVRELPHATRRALRRRLSATG